MKGNLTPPLANKHGITNILSWRLAVLFGLTMAISTVARGQQKEWWFDVEVIVYKRNIDPASIVEKFPEQLNVKADTYAFENLQEYLYPDLQSIYVGLPLCFSDSVKPAKLSSKVIMDDTFGQFKPFEQAQFVFASAEQADDVLAVMPEVDSIEVTEPASTSVYLDVWQLDFPLTPIKLPKNYLCRLPEETPVKPFIEKVPTLISGTEDPASRQTQLLAKESLQLNELARDINRQRGLSTMLHMGWRQQVLFGQDKGLAMHLFAGKNYAKEFDVLDGNKILDDSFPTEMQAFPSGIQSQVNLTGTDTDAISLQPDLIEQIKLALNDENFIYREPTPQNNTGSEELGVNTPAITDDQELWELDGTLKVFLRYIQRTPYLHIDGNMDFRAPVFDTPLYQRQAVAAQQVQTVLPSADRLQSYPFKQLRRVISNQVHYFDHPMFGMVIQIRRYDLPASFDETKIKEQ